MNKKIKRILTITTLIGTAMYAFNKYTDYVSGLKCLTLEDNENYYDWRNGTIFYQKKGNGKPILLIHDLNPVSSSYEWSQIIDLLSKRNTVYAIDLLGCGKSDKPLSSYVNYLYVELLNDFINDVIKEKTDIIVTGESFSFTVMAARMNKDIINKITAIHPTDITYNVQSPTISREFIKRLIELPILGTFIYNYLTNKQHLQKEFTEKYYYNASKIPQKLIDTYYESAHLQKSNGKYLYASILGKYTNINIIHALKVIDQPIHFIVTESFGKEIEKYKEYNDQIKIDYLSDAGYLPQLEIPNKILSLLE